MSVHRDKGFTLIEMLVVVAIILILAAILVPAVGRVIELGRRTNCRSNVREIARASIAYADSPREHRGSTPKFLPAITVSAAIDNRNCMWRPLVIGGYVTAAVFVCPSVDGAVPANLSNDSSFSDTTCSYSYQSMKGFAVGTRPYSLLKAPTGMVIVADKSPRTGGTGPYNYAQPNSQNHGQEYNLYVGQNLGAIDGSAVWNSTAIVATGSNTSDYIFQGGGTGSDDPNGIAGSTEDVFLIP